VLPKPPSFHDFTSMSYYLFPRTKFLSKGQRFQSMEDVKEAFMVVHKKIIEKGEQEC
jgi:hypothetical protein